MVKPCRVRAYQARDAAAVAALQEQGTEFAVPGADGAPPGDDADLWHAHIDRAYHQRPPNRFWVAEAPDGREVGCAGLMHHHAMVAHLHDLAVVAPWHEAGLVEALVRAAARHSHRFGYLKLLVAASPLVGTLPAAARSCGLRYARRRAAPQPVLEFYVDLDHRLEPDPADAVEPTASGAATELDQPLPDLAAR